jgi:hypothetical protein
MSAAQPPWPDELDALVAAPTHHTLLLENERVRVLDTRVERGDSVPVHTHRSPSIQYLASVSDFVRRDSDGLITADTRETTSSLQAPLIHAIVVELKA